MGGGCSRAEARSIGSSSTGGGSYIFPGVGLGVIASGASRVTDEMFYAAALTLADQATERCLEEGCVYPALTSIRTVSARIGTAVAEEAYASGLATLERPHDLEVHVTSLIWDPAYESYI